MSKLPNAYGFCKAGCEFRVPHYDEFKNSAAFIPQDADTNGVFILDERRTYRAKNSNVTDGWGISLAIDYSVNVAESTEVISGSHTMSLSEGSTIPNFDKYAECLKIRMLEVYTETSIINSGISMYVVYEMNGERYTYEFPFTTMGEVTMLTYKLMGATEVLLVNEDAHVSVKTEDAIDVEDIAGGHRVTIIGADGVAHHFDILNGEDGKDGTNGKDGADGSDGVSVTSVEQTTTSTEDGGENIITVTLSNGNKSTFKVKNGNKGSAGKDGKNGEDGISPIIETSKSGNVTTIALTDINGRKYASIVDGNDGADGENGYNPTVAVNDITEGQGGKEVVITYKDGTSIKQARFELWNGEDGKNGTNGTNGKNGEDGISPMISTSKSGNVTTIVLTDVNGTKYASILDGADGKDGHTPTDSEIKTLIASYLNETYFTKGY